MKQKRLNFDPLLLFSFVIAALFLAVCSKSSPLYPMNDWVDTHCFFTVGKGILHGIVPYAQLYEQKGPVLYFLYAIAALISDRSFFGVYLLEVVTFGLFLYYSGKIAQIYLGKSLMCYIIVPVLSAVVAVSQAFSHGGGAEELCLFMLAYGLYSVLLAMHEKRSLTFTEAFLNGIFAAAVLYIKFTIVGFYLGLALFVIFWYLCDNWNWKALLITIGHFLLGVAAVSAVVFGYFLINGAADDLIRVYFYNNLFLYPQEAEGTKYELIKTCLKNTLQLNTSYGSLIYLGLLLFVIELRKNWLDLVVAMFTFIGLTVGTYWGGRGYTYYGLILSGFALFGLIAIGKALLLADIPKWFGQYTAKIPGANAVIIVLLILVLLNTSYDRSGNTYLMDYEKADMPAYRFAETINKVENAKILNYGFLDGGFYYAADVLPNCEFFCTLNINAPDMWETQREYIQRGKVDFVITRTYTLDQYSAGMNGYELADTATFYFEGVDFTYYLYQRVSD